MPRSRQARAAFLYTSLAAALLLRPASPAVADGTRTSTDRASLLAGDERDRVARLDTLVAAEWAAAPIEPADLAEDAEFLRRAYLDLVGRIPTVGEAYAFLDDDDPLKRSRLIQRLLESPVHANYFAALWRDWMLPPNNNPQLAAFQQPLEGWLRLQFADNRPYDAVVRDVLTATGNAGQFGPVAYYTALELKPEELAAATSELFLGVQIQCAQCHDHPFDHWTQQDFWGYAAFFARVAPPEGQQANIFQVAERDDGDLILPGTDIVALPTFLGGEPALHQPGVTRRTQLADWMTAPDNPYLARALVNRLWAHFMGLGFVEPVDDMGTHNPPSHPQLLDELAADFIAHGYDMRRLMRIITHSLPYHLSSEVPPGDTTDPQLFARMAIKSLSAEQIYDCLAQAVGMPNGLTLNNGVAFRQADPARATFLRRFTAPTQGRTEFEAAIPQALTLMNGEIVAAATHLENSRTLAALVDSPFYDDHARIEVLFLATLSRPPRDDELGPLLEYVASGGPTGDRRRALADVFWALLNSAEFIFNH